MYKWSRQLNEILLCNGAIRNLIRCKRFPDFEIAIIESRKLYISKMYFYKFPKNTYLHHDNLGNRNSAWIPKN